MNLTLHTFWFIFIPALVLIAYFLKECFFKTKDADITNNITDKFPLVSFDFMNKSAKARDIENNQEIHELNKRIDHLEQYVEEMNTRIENQLDLILKEFNKRG